MGRAERLTLFSHAADGFFAGVEWLAAPAGVPGIALQVAAGFTRLLIDQAGARFEAVVDQPIGVLSSGYDVPGPDEIFDWFEFDPEPPEIKEQFAEEIRRGDWRALQRVHRILHEVCVLKRPLLVSVFAREIAARDWRAVVDGYDAAKAQVDRLVGNPRARSALKQFYTLITGSGPEKTNAEAQARLVAHWHRLRDVVVEGLT